MAHKMHKITELSELPQYLPKARGIEHGTSVEGTTEGTGLSASDEGTEF